MKKSLYIVLMVLMCAAAAALFLYTTPNGLGLTNDSSAYIGGARSLLAGRGYTRVGGDGLPRAITHFPPFYSIVLAGVSKITGKDALEAAKIVSFCCVILNQALFMTALLVLTGSRFGSVIGGLTFLCAGPVLQAHVYALSETLYMTIFLTVFILSVTAARKRRMSLLLPAGLLSGALILTRYAGFEAAAAVMIYILCTLPEWKERLQGLLLYAAGAGLPAAVWLIIGKENGGSAVNRAVSLHLPAADKVEEGIRNFAGFFLPEFGGFVDKFLKPWTVVIAAGLIGLTAAVIYFGVRSFFRPSAEAAKSSLFAPALHAVVYLIMVILTVCFIDGSTLFDNRILLPFYVCAMLLIDAFLTRYLNDARLRIPALLVMLAFAALLFEDELDQIREYHRNGQGFAGDEWRESETRLAALELPADRHLFSNRQTALYLLNDQPSYILPPMFDSASFTERETFDTDKAWLDDEVLSGKAYAVVFNYREMMENEGDREWLDLVLAGLPLKQEYKDGAIFGR